MTVVDGILEESRKLYNNKNRQVIQLTFFLALNACMLMSVAMSWLHLRLSEFSSRTKLKIRN